MKRPKEFFQSIFRHHDWGAALLFSWIIVVVGWSISMLFSTVMKDMALKRFHLASESFLCWAVNQSVPAMYNHENQIQFSNQLLGDEPFGSNDATYVKETLNHFPARFITFGNQIPRCFQRQQQGTFEMRSRFADTTLTTRWEIQKNAEGTLVADVTSSTIDRKGRDE